MMKGEFVMAGEANLSQTSGAVIYEYGSLLK
jgi:hypothetical protein